MSLNKFIRRCLYNKRKFKMVSAVDITETDSELIAIETLKKGGVIALPTDTVYGLACSATNIPAINKLYTIKTRNENKPVAICIGRECDVKKWAQISYLPEGLLNSLLPGPVTLILRCANVLDKSLVFKGKVGIRIPDYDFIRKVANGLDCPVALTSANVSNQPSSVNVDEFDELWDKIDGVFDGGDLGDSNRGASTIVDLSEKGLFTITREGIALKETVEVLKKYGLKTGDS